MRRLLLSLVLVLCAFIFAQAQKVKILGAAEKSGKVFTTGLSSTNSAAITFPSATITVFDAGTTTPSSIFSDSSGTPKSNPFTASSSDATYDFFIASGAQFDIRIAPSGGSPSPFTRSGYTAPSNSTSGGSLARVAKLVVTSTYTVLAGDAGKQLVFNNAGAVAVTLAQAGTGSFTTGYWVDMSVVGGGTATITPTTSTINSATSLALTSGSGISGLMNDGTNWYGVVGSATSAAGNCPTGVVCPDDYGAVHDGSSHLLSSRYGSLAAAQSAFNGAYGFVTSLSQQIDYAAVKAASNAAFGADLTAGAFITPSGTGTTTVIVDLGAAYGVNALAGQTLFMRYPNGFTAQEPIASNTATTITLSIALPFDYHTCSGEVCLSACALPPQTFNCSQYAIGTAGEHGYTNAYLNKPLYINPGSYQLVSDTWTVRNLVGGHIYGGWRESTTINGSGIVFQTDGIWSTRIEGITFHKTTTAAGTVVDIDGNVPGHPYTTRSVQQNTFADIKVTGSSGTTANTYGVYQCRQGGASAQCENLWSNPQISAVNTAFFNNGFNALANKILRGDMQDFVTGVYTNAGWINIDGTSFESTHLYEQATQGGFDVHTGEAGVTERMVFSGIRTESLQFYKGSSSQPSLLQGVEQVFGTNLAWTALNGYTTHQVIVAACVADGSRTHAYFAQGNGTSGAVLPVFPATGTVVDGTVTWQELPFFSVDTTTITGGQVNATVVLENCGFAGPVSIGGFSDSLVDAITTNYSQSFGDWQVEDITHNLDASGGNRTYALNNAPIGSFVRLKRIDSSSGNSQTVAGGTATIDGSASLTMPVGGALVLYLSEANVWRVIAKNYGNDAGTLNGKTFAIPGTIGSTTPNTGAFTTLTSTGGGINGTVGGTTPAAGSFTTLTTSGLINGVKVYRALITQTSTSDPTAIVFENSLGGTVVLAYSGVGVYTLTLTGAFTADKTSIYLGSAIGPSATVTYSVQAIWTSANVITIKTSKQDGTNGLSGLVDAVMTNTAIRIEVNP